MQWLVKGYKKKSRYGCRRDDCASPRGLFKGTPEDPRLHDSSLIENVENASFKVFLAGT